MNQQTVKTGLLALAIALPGAAFATEPAPGSTESYSGSLAELATGVRSTPPQPTTIQSPRDQASGQATGKTPSSSGDQPEMTLRNSAGGQQGQIMQDYYAHSNVVSPRDPASGQATGIQSPRDAASGQATGYREGGANDTTHQRSAGNSEANGALVNNENIPSAAHGAATVQPGASPQTCVMNKNCQEFEAVVANSNGHDMNRKPLRNKGRKARRIHKP